MPIAALGLVLTAAILHAIWNLAVKRTKQKQIFMWWGVLVGAVLYLPLLFLSPAIPARSWPFILASALMEALYNLALTWAYDIDDFSVVYPIARGGAPALLALWGALFLNEIPSPAGFAGLFLIVLGLIIVGGGAIFARLRPTTASAPLSASSSTTLKAQNPALRFSMKGILAALLTAACISIYTAIDGAAVKFTPPIPYTVMIMTLSALFTAPVVFYRYGKASVASEWKSNWKSIIIIGILMLLTYILVLSAYSLSKVTYAGAVREVSVVFGAIIGWRLLGEGFGFGRTIGAILIFIGILIIAILG